MIRKFVAASAAAASLLLPVSAVVVATAPTAIAAPAAPSAGQLHNKLVAAMNGDASELESGSAAGIQAVSARIAQIPGYSWDVSGPVSVNGDVLSATLNSRLGAYAFPIPVTWVNVGETWKFSQESEELLVSYANMAW